MAHIDSRNDETYNRNKLNHLSSKTLNDTKEKQIENIKSCGFGNPHIQNPSLCCQVY